MHYSHGIIALLLIFFAVGFTTKYPLEVLGLVSSTIILAVLAAVFLAASQ